MSVKQAWPATATVQVTLRVTYDLNGASPESVERVLIGAMEHLASRGLLSSESDAVVDDWSYTVEGIA